MEAHEIVFIINKLASIGAGHRWVSRVVRPSQTKLVLTREHEPFVFRATRLESAFEKYEEERVAILSFYSVRCHGSVWLLIDPGEH
jgi:hypothetical protein